MGSDDLFEGLARDLEAAGEVDGEELLSRWFETGQVVTGLSAPTLPESVEAVEAAGVPQEAVSIRVVQLQSLWLIITGARAEYEQAQLSGDHDGEARLLRALSMLVAVSEEESAAVNAALKAQSN
jgi:hypothetical protein